MAGKAEVYYLKGKCKWAKLISPDTKFEPAGVWTINLYPDDESLGVIKKLKEAKDGAAGILNTIKVDEDGPWIQLKRKTQATWRGAIKAFTPPEILDAAGISTPGVKIGNGSDVTIKIEVYPYAHAGKKGHAARLCAVRVDSLIPYDKDSYTEEEEKLVGALASQPKPLF